MTAIPIELDLPLEAATDTDLTEARRRHLLALPGVDERAAARLARAFPSLAAVYAAPVERLAAVVGPVTAARVRWFLEAPLALRPQLTAVPARIRRPVTPRAA